MTHELLSQIVNVDDSPLHVLHMQASSRDPGAYRGGGPHPQGPDNERHHPPEELAHSSRNPEGPILCMDCHGSSNNRAHQFAPSRANCVQCHAGQGQAEGRLQQLVCQECHFDGFLGTKPAAKAHP